jgi:FkbM family methyltransferase
LLAGDRRPNPSGGWLLGVTPLALSLEAASRNVLEMSIGSCAEASHQKRAASFPNRLSEGIGWRLEMLKFALRCGLGLKDCVRLFYHTAVKPSLVFRGLSRYSPERILDFSIKANSGSKFLVYARDNGLEVGTIAEFFAPACRLIPDELPAFQPDIIYDIGANIGIASLRFAAIHPEARVFGFEPLPSNLEVCALNYRNLRGAQLCPWAVGSRTEMTSFELNEDPRGGHLKGVTGAPGLYSRGRIEVQVYSIADLIREQRLAAPNFVKIDVEGAEMEVLRGIGEDVQSIKRFFIETHGEPLKAECHDWLRQHGFKVTLSADPTALWGHRV